MYGIYANIWWYIDGKIWDPCYHIYHTWILWVWPRLSAWDISQALKERRCAETLAKHVAAELPGGASFWDGQPKGAHGVIRMARWASHVFFQWIGGYYLVNLVTMIISSSSQFCVTDLLERRFLGRLRPERLNHWSNWKWKMSSHFQITFARKYVGVLDTTRLPSC